MEAGSDVCIVGAGAAGGTMARELARRGLRVAVLEAGPRHDVRRRGEYARRYLKHENPWRTPDPGLDRHTVGGANPYHLEGRRTRGVGGSTLAWEGYAVRFDADDFRLRSLHGVAADWPLSYTDLEPYYARAEAGLGVAGADGDRPASPRSTPFPLPAFPFSHSDRLFAPACQALGIAVHHLPQARNSRPFGGRPACQACGTCHVCPTGAKASIDLTHLAEPGDVPAGLRLLTGATVLRLELDRSGEVAAAVYAGADGVQRRLTARVFALAAGAVENARLLLLSTSRAFPDGLANRSGLVGVGFMSHPSIDVTGRAAGRVNSHRVGFSTAMSRQFGLGPDRATRAALLLEFLNTAGSTPERLAVASGLWGAALKAHVRNEFGRRLGIRVYCEQLPDPGNVVRLNSRVKDSLGSPVAHIHYGVGAYEQRGLGEARAVAGRILGRLGLTDIQATSLSFAAHQLGTHRMGTDPRASVVDAELRVHDVPNLYLVGGGSFVTAGTSPPTLTIVALALRAARHIAARLRAPAAPDREFDPSPSRD